MNLKLEKLSEIKPSKADFVLTDFIPLPKAAVSIIASMGGIGKTTLALQLASRYGKKCALWLTEDYAGQVRKRYEQLVEEGLADEMSMSKIHLILNDPPQLAKREKGLFKANYEEIAKIGEELIVRDISFVVFDPLLAFYGGNENDNAEARVFIQTFASWAAKAEITTVIIHHAAKGSEDAARGASAFIDGVRCAYFLDYPRDKKGKVNEKMAKMGYRTIKLIKDNWGAFKYFKNISDDGNFKATLKITPSYQKPKEIEFNDDKVELPYV